MRWARARRVPTPGLGGRVRRPSGRGARVGDELGWVAEEAGSAARPRLSLREKLDLPKPAGPFRFPLLGPG